MEQDVLIQIGQIHTKLTETSGYQYSPDRSADLWYFRPINLLRRCAHGFDNR